MVETDNAISVIAADFDGDSSRAASSGNNFYWATHSGLHIDNKIDREWGYYAPVAVELAAQSAFAHEKTPLLLGGGHSLTYWMVRAAVRHHGKVNVLVFDAHHDRYNEKRLCHYTVMGRIQEDLPVALVPIGNRFETELAVPIARDPYVGAPWYVSIDVDFFSPQVLASVMHAVESHECVYDVDRIRNGLERIPRGSEVIGADIVEWIHARATGREIEVIKQVVAVIVSLLSSRRCA